MSIAVRRINPIPLFLVFMAICVSVEVFLVGKFANALTLDRIPHILSSPQCHYPQSSQELSRNMKLAFEGLERKDGGSYYLSAFVMYAACGQRVPELWPSWQ